jgi:DNA-binding NarL/FixJ family response regulator
MSKSRADIRILIANHNSLFKEGLRTLIEERPGFSVVGEAINGKDALRLARLIRPDILLLDNELPDLSAIEVLRSIRDSGNGPRIIVLAADIKRDQVPEAFKLGAKGLISKGSDEASLFKCIGAVMDGQSWLPGKEIPGNPLLRKDAERAHKTNMVAVKYGITKREMEMLTAIVTGRTNREIAKRFSISEQTVKHHVTNIFDKVGVYNRLELALFAIHNGLTASDINK